MKKWSLLIGRWQCIPPHDGHVKLIRTVLNEGKNVCIGLREADFTDKNPYCYEERELAFQKIFEKEIKEDRVRIVRLPDVIEVVHGRKVGWSVRQIKLDKETEAISGTKMREENAKKKNK